MNGQSETTCPRCHVGRLEGWNELGEEQREAVARLPASADYTQDERRTLHRWCVECWYEESERATFDT